MAREKDLLTEHEIEMIKLDKFFKRQAIIDPIIEHTIGVILAAAFALVFGGAFTMLLLETNLPKLVCWLPVIALFIYLLKCEMDLERR